MLDHSDPKVLRLQVAGLKAELLLVRLSGAEFDKIVVDFANDLTGALADSREAASKGIAQAAADSQESASMPRLSSATEPSQSSDLMEPTQSSKPANQSHKSPTQSPKLRNSDLMRPSDTPLKGTCLAILWARKANNNR